MGLVELFILAVGLSMDAFAVSVCKGLSLGKIKAKHCVIAGIWFGGFQALMPLIGYFLGIGFSDLVSRFSHWIAFVLLLFLGGKMIFDVVKRKTEEDTDASMSPKNMFLLAIATSIDALAVGVTFAFLEVQIIPAVSLIGIVTFAFSACGVKIGSLFGMKYKNKAQIAGGIILIFLGVKILIDGLGLI